MNGAPQEAIDFLQLCLTIDSDERKSAAELLKHPIFKDLTSMNATAKVRISCPVDHIKDGQDYTIGKIKKHIMHMVKKQHKRMEARLQSIVLQNSEETKDN